MRLLLLLAALLTAEAVQIKGPNGQIYDEVKKGTEDGWLEAGEDEKDLLELNKDVPGLIHGDIVPRKDERNAITESEYYWTDKTVPFRYSDLAGVAIGLEAVGSIELARIEYGLRTCINLVPQTIQPNFVSFQRRSGCFSSVGMVGGGQTISIGSGCERLGTVCHEVMHALGIFHEQSRADRDDYVEIMWDIITPGRENNFNKYDWETTDAHRIAYDYNSIMHYGDTGFSTTGDPTIVTRDPAFQDVIGQRSTFSRGDSEKINKMYQCNDTLLNSYNCNFDELAECGYVQDFDSDDIEWKRYDVGDSSVTVPPMAPATDATLGISGKGTYMILDTSGDSTGKVAEMRSMRFVSKSDTQCLMFSYYMNKQETNTASVTVHIGTLDDINGTVIDAGSPIITLHSDYGNKWQVERMTINAPEAYRVIFMGTTGGSSNDVIAIDDVSVQDKPCEDAYFVTQDWSTILNTYSKGEHFLSPVMKTTEGYSFHLKIYPRGSTSSAEGYMSMFFGLVQGPDDDGLIWPFCNRFVRMMIVDQNDNPLYSLHRFIEILTSQELGGAMWNKPNSTEKALGYFGYHNFFSLDELQNSNNYLKHDSLMLSLLTQNMNWVRGDVCNASFTRSSGKDASPRAAYSDHEGNVGIDWVDGPPEEGHGDGDHQHHHHEEHHDHDHEEHHDHDHEEHHDHDHEEHHDHDHEEHHDHDHDDDSKQEGMVPLSTTIGVAAGAGVFVLLVMSGVLCCVVKSHKQNMKRVVNNVVVHTNTPVPPAYPEEKITFESLPLPKA